MQKKYIICGIPRAGKTTLANRLAEKLWCSRIPCDPFIAAFHNIYPELWITHKVWDNDELFFETSRKFTIFLIDYIKSWLDNEFDTYVIEWFNIDVDLIYKELWQTHQVVVMWYPNITYEEKISLTRYHDGNTGDRTNNFEDEILKRDIQRYIHLSKIYQKKAEILGITFIDTSSNFEEAINSSLSCLIS